MRVILHLCDVIISLTLTEISRFKDNLLNELVAQLYKEHLLGDLMKETEDVAARRKEYREMKELLMAATEIINEVRDFNAFK